MDHTVVDASVERTIQHNDTTRRSVEDHEYHMVVASSAFALDDSRSTNSIRVVVTQKDEENIEEETCKVEIDNKPSHGVTIPNKHNIPSPTTSNGTITKFFEQQCFIEWSNISYPSLKKPLLHNLSGFAAPGKITGVVGSASSGKSMLLRILSRRGPFKLHDGEIALNGQLIQDKLRDGLKKETNKYRSLVSFVSKDYNLTDLSLTVKETLQYALKFKLPLRSTNNPIWSTRDERLEMILKNYGLKKKENMLCSSLSTGEKKRLTIAVQNVNFHRVVIIEDPTDGMEYGESMMIMKTLKTMARMGISVIISVHKPSLREFEMFDYVSILDRGRQIYFGKPCDMLNYFNNMVGINMEDCQYTGEETLSSTSSGPSHSLESLMELLFIHELSKSASEMDDRNMPIKELIESNHVDAAIREKRDHLTEEFEKRKEEYYLPQKIEEEQPYLHNKLEDIRTEKYHANYFASILVLVHRLFKVKSRNWLSEFLAPFIEKVLLAIGIGLLYLQVDPANMGMRARVFAFLNFNLSLTFGIAIRNLLTQIPTLMQERTNSSSYRISAYYIAKTVEDMFDFTVYPFIFGVIVYFMTGMSLEAYRFFTFATCFVIYNWACMALAQMLVTLFPSAFILGFLCSVLNIYFILVSSAYGPTMLPSGLKWFSYLSYLYYGFRSMAINEFVDVNIVVQNGTILPSTYYTNGTYFVKRVYDIDGPWYMSWVYIAVLFAYFLICKFIGYLGLRFVFGRKSPKRAIVKIVKLFKKCLDSK